jgi:tetratricopeptide (TPR) repeat protein/TolB-like protein
MGGAQPLRIAIIDFDNISGITKYDGLGKAMSSMLISDIESNVSPKRLQLVERSQINKVLKEQNLQKTASFDKNTAVRMGKLLGVGYLLIGDIYILDNTLVINARLTDVSTGDIKFSEKQEGKINEWLTIKTKLGKAVATSISMPFTDPRIPDAMISPAILTTYASAIEENDKGNYAKAETLINTAKDYNPEFGYLDDLREDIEKLKKEVQKLQVEIENAVDDPIKSAYNFFLKKDFSAAIKYFQIGLNRIPNTEYGSKYAYYIFLSEAYLENKEYFKAIDYSDSVIQINPHEPAVVFMKAKAYSLINESSKALQLLDGFYKNRRSVGDAEVFFKNIFEFSKKNKSIALDNLRVEHTFGSIIFTKKIQSDSYLEFIQETFGKKIPNRISKLRSGDYEFNQRFDFDTYLNQYVAILENTSYDSDAIAKLIEKLELSDESDVFQSYSGSHTIAGIRTVFIKDTGEYVYAKNGKFYTGSAHFAGNRYFSILGYGMYTNVKSSGGMSMATIECPCELLILKSLYEVINQNKGSININNFEHTKQIFTSGWYYLLAGKYTKSIDMFLSVIKYYIKYSRSIEGLNLYEGDYDDMRMAYMNLAHSYLLYGNFDKAVELYKNKLFIKDFGKLYGNMSKFDVIKNDWEDFISKGLISRLQLQRFNEKYKIITYF